MKAVSFLRLLAVAILLFSAVSVAQKVTGPKYVLANEVTLKGVVEEVKEVPRSCLGETGLHLMLKTDKETVEVQVAPVDFMKFMEVTFAKGEKLDIVASKVSREGAADLYLARVITHNSNEVAVRDKKGEPGWTWMKKSGEAAK